MSYDTALRAAGAEVIAYASFGDYQGTWLAKVKVNGKEGWVQGYYGSCSGCDAFEGEFGYGDSSHYHKADGSFSSRFYADHEDGDVYVSIYSYGDDDNQLDPEKCQTCEQLLTRLKAFGSAYLSDLMSQEEAEQQFQPKPPEEYDWDRAERAETLAFIRQLA